MLILRKDVFINQLKLITIILLITAEFCESKRSRPPLKKKLLTSKIRATFKIKPLRKPDYRPSNENKAYSLNWPHAVFGHAPLLTTMHNANNIPPFGAMDPLNYLSVAPSLPYPLNALSRADVHIPAPMDINMPLWQPHVVYKIINDGTLENLHPRRTNIQQGFFANQPLLQFSNPVDFNFASERFVYPPQMGTNILGSLM